MREAVATRNLLEWRSDHQFHGNWHEAVMASSCVVIGALMHMGRHHLLCWNAADMLAQGQSTLHSGGEEGWQEAWTAATVSRPASGFGCIWRSGLSSFSEG